VDHHHIPTRDNIRTVSRRRRQFELHIKLLLNRRRITLRCRSQTECQRDRSQSEYTKPPHLHHLPLTFHQL
jgi:hypothetical protein